MKTPGYTISQAARMMEVTRLTVYHWIDSGRLTPIRTPTRYLIPSEQVTNIRLGIQ